MLLDPITLSKLCGSYNTIKTVTLTVTDHVDPNPKVYYSTNGGSTWSYKTKTVTLTFGQGVTTLKYYGKDATGNTGSTQTRTYTIDKTLPTVTANLAAGVYNTTKSVTLTAKDNLDPNPTIYYTTNGKNPTTSSTKYTGPIKIIHPGTTTLKFMAVDKAGNQAIIQTQNYVLKLISNINTGKTYSKFQDAINDPLTLNNHMINVKSGTYTENIIVNKSLTIMPTAGGKVIIQALNASNPVFTINSLGNGTKIQGFTIKGVTATNANGIYLNGTSKCNIIGNTLISNYNGIKLNNSINNVIQDNDIRNSSWFAVELNYSNNNTVQNNDMTNNYYGVHLGHSNNAIISGNNITNSKFGINPQYSTAQIHFNRITRSSSFGLVSQFNSTINAKNNWWGTNTPSYINSPNWVSTYHDVYNCGSVTSYNPWLILSFDADSCTSSDVNAGVTTDLTHNNQGNDTSSSGHVPNGIPVKFTTNFGTITSPVYTVKGKATTIVNVGNTQTRIGNISSSVDRQSISAQLTINTGSAVLNVISNALDNSTGQKLKITYTLPLNNSVSWVSVLLKNTGLFQEEMDLIVNGNVVLNKTLVNSAYRTYKNSYSQQVFNQINYFNTLFSNSAETSLLLQTLIEDNPQLKNLTGTQLTDGILSVIKEDNNFTDSEINFIKNNHKNFIDPVTLYLYYTGETGKSINITDPETNDTLNLKFPGNSMSMGSSIFYRNGSFVSQHFDQNNNPYMVVEPAGYEGVKSYSIATTKVTDNILQHWLNQASLYQPGVMKAAYGTFLTALLVEYCHDQVANNVTSEFNVTWSRTSPIVISAGDDALLTYLTLNCDHSMGMTVTGLPENMAAFRFACSSVISAIEQNVMEGLGFDYQVNTPAGHVSSVMTDMVDAFMNGTSLEAFESNGYVVLKAVGRDDLIFVIDPETGIVRDMNTVNGFCGSYCYYDLQTELAESLGNALLNTTPQWLSYINKGGKKGGEWIPPKWRGKTKKEEAQENVDEAFKKIMNLDRLPIPGDSSKLIAGGILATIILYIAHVIDDTIPDYEWENTTYNNTTNATKLIIRKST